MDKPQVLGFAIWFILNVICEISAGGWDPKNSPLPNLPENTIKDANVDNGYVLTTRNKRDVNVNADNIYDEVNRLYDKIDELNEKLEKMNDLSEIRSTKTEQGFVKTENSLSALSAKIDQNKLTDKTKFEDLDAKFGRIEELISKKFNDCINITKENEIAGLRKVATVEENTKRIDQSISNLTRQLSVKIEEIERKDAIKFTKMKEKLEMFNQQITNTSNRIRDGPLQCRKWPRGKVPFEIDPSLNMNTTNSIEDAISDFHSKTGIRWIPRQSETAFVYFVNENNSRINKTEECYSGGRRISIIGAKFTKKDILRQMAYILGFGDEHLRKDRDKYIEVRRDNCTMQEKYLHLNGGGFYDYISVTHADCSEETCLQQKDYVELGCGNPQSLSHLDVEKINEMYNCKGCQSLRFHFPNQIGFNESEVIPVFENAHENRKHICRVNTPISTLIGRGNVKTGECHYLNMDTDMQTENVQFLTNTQNAEIQWVPRGKDFPTTAIPGIRTYLGTTGYIARCIEEPQWGESVVLRWVSSLATSMEMRSRNGTIVTCSAFDILTC